MSNLMSSLGTAAPAATTATRRTAPSPYEANLARFGPVAASAIGVVQAAAPAASAVVSFSDKAMKQLSEVAPAIAEAIEDVADGAQAVWNQGADLVHGLEHLADSAASAVGEATDTVTDALKTAAGNVVGYALLGAAGAAGLIDDIA